MNVYLVQVCVYTMYSNGCETNETYPEKAFKSRQLAQAYADHLNETRKKAYNNEDVLYDVEEVPYDERNES